MAVIEVFADVLCPFAHAGLRKMVVERANRRRTDVVLRIRAWPLEQVNGAPLEAATVGEEIEALRSSVAPDLFAGFDTATFPQTSLPALAQTHAAYRAGLEVGERVALALRDAVFERGVDLSDPGICRDVVAGFGVGAPTDADVAAVAQDREEGAARGVEGSPYFFVAGRGFFCPSLEIHHDAEGFHVGVDEVVLEQFFARCFA
ncbi:MAG TPA: DsbA family protein [Acidimicrobiales bacterium]|nr:DsbA family protein [Acidimicrobiales bacterium]